MSAVSQFSGRTGKVWAVEDGTLTQMSVTLGRQTLDGRIEVVGGLPIGVQIVIGPLGGLREGRRAKIVQGEK
jgi:HlyD family secretion protein